MRYAAFLRAINVGGRTVRMETLRDAFERLGLTAVETVVASGNVLFDSPVRSGARLEQAIEAALEERLGYPVATFVRSAAEMAAIAAGRSLAGSAAEGGGIYVGFLRERPAAAAERRVLACADAQNGFAFAGRECYWTTSGAFSQSVFSGARLEKLLGAPATIRNATTVRKVAALMTSAAAARRARTGH